MNANVAMETVVTFPWTFPFPRSISFLIFSGQRSADIQVDLTCLSIPGSPHLPFGGLQAPIQRAWSLNVHKLWEVDRWRFTCATYLRRLFCQGLKWK
jgi:hypothetical protein